MLLVRHKINVHPLINILINNSALLLLEYPSSLKSRMSAVDGHPDDYPTIGPETIARETALMSRNFLPGGAIGLAQVSPFILHLLYQTCIILSGAQDSTSGDDIKSFAILREALTLLTERWLSSGRRSHLWV